MSETDKKRAKMTPEQKEESRKLRRIYDERRAQPGSTVPSQAKIGEDFHIGNQSMVGHLLGGRSALTLESAVAFAKVLNCEIEDFSPRLAEKQRALASAARPDTQASGTAQGIAKALRITVQAISERWGISIADLMDGSDEAMSRVEASISARLPLQEESAAPVQDPQGKKPSSHPPASVRDYNPPGAGRRLEDDHGLPKPSEKDGSAED